jgi:hypothetical protein
VSFDDEFRRDEHDGTGVADLAVRLVALRPSVTLLPIPDEVGARCTETSVPGESVARLDASW